LDAADTPRAAARRRWSRSAEWPRAVDGRPPACPAGGSADPPLLNFLAEQVSEPWRPCPAAASVRAWSRERLLEIHADGKIHRAASDHHATEDIFPSTG